MTKNLTILIIVILFGQTELYSQTKTKITFGGNVTYHLGTSSQKDNTSPFIFFKNGQSAGLDLTLIPKKGTTRFKLAADYILGTNDENAIAIYAKMKDIPYTNYKFTIPKPRGFSIMASPQFMLFPKSQNKKLPLIWLDLKAGALFSNQQNLLFFQGQTTPSKEIISNALSFVYNPSLVVNLLKTKKLFLNLRAGYSNFGGIGFGISITDRDCTNISCCRCEGARCSPSCNPSVIESINN